jgi:hypothetical protein
MEAYHIDRFDRRVTAGDTVLTQGWGAYRSLPCNSPGSWVPG